MTKTLSVRHNKTNLLLGFLTRNKADPLFACVTSADSTTCYSLSVAPKSPSHPLPVLDLDRTIHPVCQRDLNGDCLEARKATVLIDQSRKNGRFTIWVDRASELFGVEGFRPYW